MCSLTEYIELEVERLLAGVYNKSLPERAEAYQNAGRDEFMDVY